MLKLLSSLTIIILVGKVKVSCFYPSLLPRPANDPLGIQLPTPDGGIRDFHTQAELQRCEDYVIDPKIKSVTVGFDWNKEQDLDGSAILFGERCQLVDAVWYKKLCSACGSVARRKSDFPESREKFQELMEVQLNKVPLTVHHILFACSVFGCAASSNETTGPSIRMQLGESKYGRSEMCRFRLNQTVDESMVLGQLTRRGGYWNFKAVGLPATGRSVSRFLKNASNFACLHKCQSSAPTFRNIAVCVVKASSLSSGIGLSSRKRETTNPDPYYEIKYKKRVFASKHIPKSTDPVWKWTPFELGASAETDQKALKITVFSYDPISSDGFLGTIRIPSRALYNAGVGEHRLTFPLGPSKTRGLHNDNVSGKITLNVVVSEVITSNSIRHRSE